ncbi:MAG TPA: DUF2231 domain-containing protein [Actinomycetota bacterium]|nr:DUF2231 domain-containing protein [Actinomycetota bacterium]
MAIRLRYRSETGETRNWTLKEIVQGYPLGHPSHPLFVHFPIAFYSGTLALDILTRITPNAGLVLAATYLYLGAFAGTLLLVITGLVDWLGMVPGSTKRRIATRHMLLQLAAAAFFIVTFLLRWESRTQPQAEVLWIVLEAVGYAILSVGQYLGGVLVYEKAMRVGGKITEAAERPPAR